MQTEIIKITDENSKETILKAAKIIQKGGLVVFPTETVYGLGASVLNDEALGKIFSAKGRPSDNPVIVHISDYSQLEQLTKNISPIEQKLIDSFWPGPLTIIFEKGENISNIVSGGLSTIAVRMPSFAIAQSLINESGVPIAAPSANISGRPSSTNGDDAYGDLIGKVDMIIDSGASAIGIESTVVKADSKKILILRPGAITKEMLEEITKPLPVIFTKDNKSLQSSPGTKYKHYAPKAKMVLQKTSEMPEKASLLEKEGLIVGIICTNQNKDLFKKYEPNVFSLGDENNLEQVSKSLYSALRFFDTHNVDAIVCISFPERGLGTAIMDRLNRASGKKN